MHLTFEVFDIYWLFLLSSLLLTISASHLPFLKDFKLSKTIEPLIVDFDENLANVDITLGILNRSNIDVNSVHSKRRIHRKVGSRRRRRAEFDARKPILSGYRIDDKDVVVEYESEGTVAVEHDKNVKIRIYGRHMTLVTSVRITASDFSCEDYDFSSNSLTVVDNERQFVFYAKLPRQNVVYHFCLCLDEYLPKVEDSSTQKSDNDTHSTVKKGQCFHQGRSSLMLLKTRTPAKIYYLPIPLQIIIIICLMVLSGLFSGLNLGLMSLDTTELKILLKVGNIKEQQHAKRIYPIRKSGNYLLCTLLLGNVVVNSAISILFDDLTSGLIALVFASLGIVVFGEIVPQAICSRYGLAVGARTYYITRFFMMLTFPLSWPISRLLDKLLGEEVRQTYSRERLLELIRLSKEDEAANLGTCQEVQIVTGALELYKKTVSDVMTPINDVFMLSSDVILDPKTVSEIVKSGFTRIPVYERDNRNNIVNMLNVKDLALLDPEDKIPLRTICQFYHHPVRFVMDDTPLGVMLEEFKKGHYHLAIVQRIVELKEAPAEEAEDAELALSLDRVYEPRGLITLEDIIEEIIQSEIRDEFDIIRDLRQKRQKRRETTFALAAAAAAAVSAKTISQVTGTVNPSDVSIFFNQSLDACDISPQLTLAAYQYLSTTFNAFRTGFISENVLQRLIRQNVLRKKASDASIELYSKGKESNHFILILEGKCSITVGESNLLFDAGPFCSFGYELLDRVVHDIENRRSSFGSYIDKGTIMPSHVNPASSLSYKASLPSQATKGSICCSDQHALVSSRENLSDHICPPIDTQHTCGRASLVAASPVDISGKKFTFVPDYTLKCDQQALVYVKITPSAYIKAYRATLIEWGRTTSGDDHAAILGASIDGPKNPASTAPTVPSLKCDSAPGSPTMSVSNKVKQHQNLNGALGFAGRQRSSDTFDWRAFDAATVHRPPTASVNWRMDNDKVTVTNKLINPALSSVIATTTSPSTFVTSSLPPLDFKADSIIPEETDTDSEC